MKKAILFLSLCISIVSCKIEQVPSNLVDSSDIPLFWTAYDAITQTKDSLEQVRLLNELYLEPGSAGLKGMVQAKNYTQEDFIDAINNYPKFWSSIRANTLTATSFEKDLAEGIEKLRKIYPSLKPAKIYFTIGALRSNGTTRDSLVLIGSEYAMSDENTDASEFPEAYRTARKTYFQSNPIKGLVLLNIHEYVHTQQNPLGQGLLFQCVYEGVAEFVSVTAMDVPSAAPAVAFGKANEKAVKAKFERDMFFGNKTYEWIWGDADNGFDVRDLGYYIGYEICERYYKAQTDKQKAIQRLVDLDYTNTADIEKFVDETKFFSQAIQQLRQQFQTRIPRVFSIEPFSNGSRKINSNTKEITLTFSRPMDVNTRGFDYGPLGEKHVLGVQKVIGFSEDKKAFTFEVKLAPNKQYQSVVTSNFLSEEGIPLTPYLIDFTTKK